MKVPTIAKWAGFALASIMAGILFFIFLFELGILRDQNSKVYPATIETYQEIPQKNTCLPAA